MDFCCAGHVVKQKGALRKSNKSSESLDDRNLIAGNKGVPGDWETEGSSRQKFVTTNRNRIQGKSQRGN